MDCENRDIGKGTRSAISISNTRKITANRKNRVENGVRADWFGSNPHSNGEIFSRSLFDREEIINLMRIKIGGITVAMINNGIIIDINN